MNCQRFEASDKLYGIVERKFRSKEWFYAEGSDIQDEWADYLRRLGINIKHARPEDFLFAARLKNYSCPSRHLQILIFPQELAEKVLVFGSMPD